MRDLQLAFDILHRLREQFPHLAFALFDGANEGKPPQWAIAVRKDARGYCLMVIDHEYHYERILKTLRLFVPHINPPDSRITVTLCGSTRFGHLYQQATLEETLAGKIVLSIGCNTKSDTDLLALGELTPEKKAALDDLHLAKIRRSNEILVLSEDGYIGESTRREIAYAKSLGLRIRYWEEEKKGRIDDHHGSHQSIPA